MKPELNVSKKNLKFSGKPNAFSKKQIFKKNKKEKTKNEKTSHFQKNDSSESPR